MTEIKVGDKIRNKGEGPGTGKPGVTRTVIAVGKTKLLYTRVADDGEFEHMALIDHVEKIEPWFEAGRLYRRASVLAIRRCIAVGHYGDTPWALLAYEPTGYVSAWTEEMGDWEEADE